MSAKEEPEPRVPTDLRKVLAATPKARALWFDITPIARRDWILGLAPPSGQRLARVGSTVPAKCSVPGSDAFAASIGPGSTVRASVLLERQSK